jgi:hypothetical protein
MISVRTVMPRDTGSCVVSSGTAEWLTSERLRKMALSKKYGAWETLFEDPDDGRLWERTYPQGEMHGGGPPALRVISVDEARAKYDFSGDG